MTLLAIPAALPQAAGDEAFVNMLVRYFNEGGGFMWPILVLFVLGLAIAFERVLALNRADVDTRGLVGRVRRALEEEGAASAGQVCARTRGPVAAVFQAGLLRADEGIDAVEKAIVSYGAIEMSYLERGLVWLSLFIALAPLFGFLGTVVGMVVAFDAIEAAGDISPTLVANGIKIALLTTVFGLIAAIILQFFYNYAVSKIDRLVVEMEVASIELIDALLQTGRSALPRAARVPAAPPDDLAQAEIGHS
jgi:biopolymer transport protein ExbB